MEASLLLWGAFAVFRMPAVLALGVIVAIIGVPVAASWWTARRSGADRACSGYSPSVHG
jgi:hypothetical protein